MDFTESPGGDTATTEKDREGAGTTQSTRASPSTMFRSPNTQRVTRGLTGVHKYMKNKA